MSDGAAMQAGAGRHPTRRGGRKLALVAAAALLFPAAALAQPPVQPPKGTQASANSLARAAGPQQFLAYAIRRDDTMVALGRLAASHAASPGVIGYSRDIVLDDSRAKKRAVRLARDLHFKVPKDMGQSKAAVTRLSGLKGHAFDKAFLAYMVRDQKDAVRRYTAQEAAHRGRVSKLAGDELPGLRKHLSDAMKLQSPSQRPDNKP